MLKFILGGIAGLIAVLAVAMVLFFPKLEAWAEHEIREAVKRECPPCEFEMGNVGLVFNGLTFENLHLAGGEKGGQWIDFRAKRIVISPVLSTLLGDEPRLKGITFDHPEVVYMDGEKQSHHKSGSLDSSKIVIDEIFFFGGKFTYIRDVKGTHAVLVVSDIDGEIDPNPQRAVANVHARIGDQGSIALRVASPYAEEPLVIETELEVKDQSLAALSEFFKPNAGVELTGTLTKGTSRSKMHGSHLETALFAEYKDFKLHVDKMYDRNEAQAFFTNLGTAIAMREKNKDLTKRDKAAAVSLTREVKESLVSFLLRGLKESALKVAL